MQQNSPMRTCGQLSCQQHRDQSESYSCYSSAAHLEQCNITQITNSNVTKHNHLQRFPLSIYTYTLQKINTYLAHRYTYAPPRCRTSQYRRTFVPFSVSLWNALSDPVFDGVGLAGFKSRANAFLFA